MSGHAPTGPGALAPLLGPIAVLVVFAVLGLTRWDATPLAALAMVLLGGFLALMLLGLSAGFTSGASAPTVPTWFTPIAIIFAVVGIVVGVITLIVGDSWPASVAFLLVGLIATLMWWKPSMFSMVMMMAWVPVFVGVMTVALGVFGVIGLAQGNETLAAAALLLAPVLIVLLGLVPWWIMREKLSLSESPFGMLGFWALMLFPFMFVVLGFILFGFTAEDDGSDVASDSDNTPAQGDDGSGGNGDDGSGGSGGSGGNDGDDGSGGSGGSGGNDGDGTGNAAPPVEPFTSPAWMSFPELLNGATFDLPPSMITANPIEFRSGPNKLENDPYVPYPSITRGMVTFTAEQIAALPNLVADNPAAGSYTAFVLPQGEPSDGVDYQTGFFFSPSASVTRSEDGQIGFGASVVDPVLRAFHDHTANTLFIADADFNQTTADVFFAATSGYQAVFVGQSVFPDGGYGWISRFARQVPPDQASPAVWGASGPFHVGGTGTTDPLEVGLTAEDINCDNLGDYAHCYDPTDIRHIFRTGGPCVDGDDFDPDGIRVTRLPGPDGDTNAPTDTITMTDPATGDSADIDPPQWHELPTDLQDDVSGVYYACLRHDFT